MSDLIELDVNGARLAAESAGEGDALVFLHAGVADRRMWQPQTAHFQKRYRTVAYDRRGFGRTTTAGVPFSHVEDLRALLDRLEIPSAVLVGCSQGGRVSIDFALAYPRRVQKLILIAPAVSGAPAPQSLPPEVEALDAELDAADEAGDLQRINEIEAQFWLDGPQSAPGRVGGDVRDLFLDMNGIALRHPDLEHEIEPPSAYERVAQLSLPALVLWGALDFAHVIERCRYLAGTIPGALAQQIPGTAHLPNLEKPRQVNTWIAKFLDGQP